MIIIIEIRFLPEDLVESNQPSSHRTVAAQGGEVGLLCRNHLLPAGNLFWPAPS